jgi:hypothetical protein
MVPQRASAKDLLCHYSLKLRYRRSSEGEVLKLHPDKSSVFTLQTFSRIETRFKNAA